MAPMFSWSFNASSTTSRVRRRRAARSSSAAPTGAGRGERATVQVEADEAAQHVELGDVDRRVETGEQRCQPGQAGGGDEHRADRVRRRQQPFDGQHALDHEPVGAARRAQVGVLGQAGVVRILDGDRHGGDPTLGRCRTPMASRPEHRRRVHRRRRSPATRRRCAGSTPGPTTHGCSRSPRR